MRIEHVAYWVKDLEKMKNFYQDYFDGQAGDLYYNSQKEFRSYFITFQSGCRMELMTNPVVSELATASKQSLGMVHLAISVGSKERVDMLTKRLEKDEYQVVGTPRVTGDGYYESVILDPEFNRIEITI